ncbi:nucleotidyltransferase family protein [Bacillus songklensis]|uniref:Nucleotidyltransferase family protein n=1 Tax=Bacillus songklensis TaxID=1069116 RepID=A0ABV8B628_9BACI
MAVDLIQALYDSRTSLPSDEEFYKQAIEDIEFFSISSQIYHLLKQQEKLEQTPIFFQEFLKQKYNEALYQNLFIKNQMELIFKEFENAGIPIIPLKGITFAEKYFGHLGARGTSDIDLLIKIPDLEKAIDCVKSLGYTTEEEYIPSHFHCSFSKHIPGSPVPLTVEIHWTLLKEKTSNLRIEEFWIEAKPLKPYNYVMELSDYHTFYMICLHGWKHNMNSLKYFIDIIQMICSLHETLDYSRLFKDAASHKTFKRVIRTLSIVYYQFPQLEEKKGLSLKKRTNLWWEYEAIRNTNVKSITQYINFAYFQFLDFDSVKHTTITIGRWLLPSKVELAFELELKNHHSSLFRGYLQLFKKRCNSFLKTMLFR